MKIATLWVSRKKICRKFGSRQNPEKESQIESEPKRDIRQREEEKRVGGVPRASSHNELDSRFIERPSSETPEAGKTVEPWKDKSSAVERKMENHFYRKVNNNNHNNSPLLSSVSAAPGLSFHPVNGPNGTNELSHILSLSLLSFYYSFSTHFSGSVRFILFLQLVLFPTADFACLLRNEREMEKQRKSTTKLS